MHSLIIQATFVISHTSSPKQNKTIEDNEGDMIVEIDDEHSKLMGHWEKNQFQEKIFVK